MLPEGGRDRIAKLFYYPVFAEGEHRASLGDLFKHDAAAGSAAATDEPSQSNCYTHIFCFAVCH